MNDDLCPSLDLPEQLLVLLREQPHGLSECELIQRLK